MPSLLATTGTMMLLPTLPLFLRERTDSLTLVSLVLAAASIGGLLANVPSGALIGRFGERRGFLGGLALSGVGTAGLALGGGVGLVLPFVACLVAGAGQASRLLARQSYARRFIGSGVRGRLMALFGGLGRVALFVGPLLGGLLAELIGFRVTFVVAGALILTAIVPVWLASRHDTPAPVRPSVETGRRAYVSVVRAHARTIGLAGLGQLGVALVRLGRLTVVPLYGAAIGLDVGAVGVVVAIAGGLDLLLFPVAGWLMDTFGRLRAIVPSFVLMSVGLILLPLAGSFWSLAAVGLGIGFGNGLGAGTMLTLSTDLAPDDNPAEFLGLLRLLADLGRVLGPLIVGVVGDRLGLGPSSVVLGMVGLATAALFAVAIGETRGPPVASR